MNKKDIQKIKVNKKNTNQRLDLYLAKKLKISRSNAQKRIKQKEVTVNNLAASSSNFVVDGDIVLISTGVVNTESNCFPTIPIVYEDDVIIIINKPSGIAVHSAPGVIGQTILDHFREKSGKLRAKCNIDIVHRLDQGTSGVMILSKDEKTKTFLQQQFRNHKVRKVYQGLVLGKVIPKEGIIELPLKREQIDRKKIGVSKAGRNAKTKFKVIKQNEKYSLLELYPETGRTHQLRVHLSALGYPIIGDLRYGKNKDKRIYLHASKLSFIHPKTKKRVDFSVKLPSDLDIQKYLPEN